MRYCVWAQNIPVIRFSGAIELACGLVSLLSFEDVCVIQKVQSRYEFPGCDKQGRGCDLLSHYRQYPVFHCRLKSNRTNNRTCFNGKALTYK
jgi:hypothetical protein